MEAEVGEDPAAEGTESPGAPPAHHAPGGGYRDPWAREGDRRPDGGDVLKWMWQRLREPRAPDPESGALGRGTPRVARPRVAADELRITWIGQSTFLVQLPELNLVTDPMFGRRASPLKWSGPPRFSPPGLTIEELPPLDGVVLSHDHYDHLDRGSVDRLHARFGQDLTWFTPLGYGAWLGRRGIRRVVELDWWQEAEHVTESGGRGRLCALPARHWTRRRLRDTGRRLWCSWSLESGGRRVYFGGDSGYCPVFTEIGERAGPFDVALLPIGAYEPRWFMRSSHMNPEEAAQACRDVRGSTMIGMHWGTFRLTDEDPLEPPRRARRAWRALGLEDRDLHVPPVGETVIL